MKAREATGNEVSAETSKAANLEGKTVSEKQRDTAESKEKEFPRRKRVARFFIGCACIGLGILLWIWTDSVYRDNPSVGYGVDPRGELLLASIAAIGFMVAGVVCIVTSLRRKKKRK